MTKFPNPPMYPSQVQLLEQNLTIKMKNNSWISRLALPMLVRGINAFKSSAFDTSMPRSKLNPTKSKLNEARHISYILFSFNLQKQEYANEIEIPIFFSFFTIT